ncbi:hypothetical protein BKA69DRAFT_1129873 [Paraphysoderma sedebokerense]|nr:hypothetical protein BKA69DRAFT_1129873 [Paraphysoderma sedebokerense]
MIPRVKHDNYSIVDYLLNKKQYHIVHSIMKLLEEKTVEVEHVYRQDGPT